MPRPRQVEPSAIALRLQVAGPQSAQALATALRADDSNIRRALILPEIAPQLVRFGTRRGTTYALRRPIRALGDTFPIRRIDATGRAHDWAELTALHGGWRVTWANPTQPPAWAAHILALGGFSEGFPFFLSEIRPQGFLGRAAALRLPPALGLGPDPRQWPSDDDTLVYLAAAGDDLPGDLLLGDAPLRRLQDLRLQPTAPLPETERATQYPAFANHAIAPAPGSSVEGEQPKFLTTLATLATLPGPTCVMVKFTDRLATTTGRRWADLLAAEAHAITILHAHAEAHAAPRLLDAGDRRFLETPRYDRAGPHGRHGVVSLRALHDALGGPDAHRWTAAAAHLHARHLIDAAALRSIRLRYTFGQLIGNTDMHFGNLAFWFDDTLPFRLAPAYDMLPMLWAPTPGDATPTPEFNPPLPLPAERELWHEAATWADDFWQRVSTDARISPEFHAQARAAHTQLTRLRTLA